MTTAMMKITNERNATSPSRPVDTASSLDDLSLEFGGVML